MIFRGVTTVLASWDSVCLDCRSGFPQICASFGFSSDQFSVTILASRQNSVKITTHFLTAFWFLHKQFLHKDEDSDADDGKENYRRSQKYDSPQDYHKRKKGISNRAKHDFRIRAQEIRSELRSRTEERFNMPGGKSSKRGGGRKGLQSKSITSPAANTRGKKKKTPRPVSTPNSQSDPEEPLDSQKVAAVRARQTDQLMIANPTKEVADLKQQLAESANTAPKSKSKPRKLLVGAQIPNSADLEQAVKDCVANKIWCETKFLANDDELFQVCQLIMEKMPEFSALLETEDEDEKVQNIKNFRKCYGKAICKRLNQKRTDTTSAMKKAYERRYLDGKQMPTPSELATVIQRKNLQILAYDKDYQPTPEEQEELDAKNEQILLNQEYFDWYWESLLPCVAGKFKWGHTIRCYTTITSGKSPENQEKYITSSDEAFVLIVYENCGQRFPYTAKCKKRNRDANKSHPKYQVRSVPIAPNLFS